MSVDALVPSAIDGLMLGFVYGLAAMGLTLIFGVMRVINLSHGPVIALGMFVVYVLFTGAGVNPYLGLIAAAGLGILFGVAIYFVAVDRIINAPELTTLLATYSVNLMIVGVATSVFTTTPRAVDISLGSVGGSGVTILGTHAVAVAIAIAGAALLYAILFRTRIGKSIRAVANNRAAAELIGTDRGEHISVASLARDDQRRAPLDALLVHAALGRDL